MDHFREIPPAGHSFTANTVLGRFIDGLGYRYYWATEGLSDEDLEYRPSKDSRSMSETLDHIHSLSETILNAPMGGVNLRPAPVPDMTFAELRESTLGNLERASEMIHSDSEDALSKYKLFFRRGEQQMDFPCWNLINGPLSDAIYHVGQVVSFRRSSGNPVHSGMNVFLGKTRE